MVMVQTGSFYTSIETCVDPDGGGGGAGDPDPPLKNHKAIGSLRSYCTGPDFMENHKATKPAFNAGPLSAYQRNAI